MTTARAASRHRGASLVVTLAVLLCSRPAGAQEDAAGGAEPPADPQPATAPADPCSAYDLTLDGAGRRSEDETAAFVESWRPSLEAAAACVRAPGAERSCIEVQGQYDEHTFDTAVARAMGGQRAAQIHRARGRSEAVVTELAEMGVPYDRIHHRPPPATATYRGVRVQVLVECVAPAPEAAMPGWAASPEVLAESLRATGLMEPAAPAPAAPEEPPSPAVGPFSIDGTVLFDFMMSRPSDAFGFGARTGFGFGENLFYARLFFGIGTADQLEQRAQVFWGASGGLRPLRWLRVGLLFTHRFGTYQAFDPWFEQSWHLGLEAEQRIVDLGRVSVWVGESLSPVGARTQRATVDGGQVLNSADRRDYALDAQLLVTVRGHLRAGAGLPGSPARAAD